MSTADSNETHSKLTPPVSCFIASDERASAHPLIDPPTRLGIIGTIGRFELLERIGEGGMGIVYLARDTNAKVGQPSVAIKILRPELAKDRRAVEYFAKEATHLQRMSHPNVLPLIEFSGDQNGAYLVMPYAARGSLAGLLKGGKPLDASATLRIAGQVASALNYAHGRGIIHRDLKPSNILIDDRGNAWLTDFGLARTLLNDSIIDVRLKQIEGTPQYQSPLVARGEHEDTRGDIYSFGAVLYEMLTAQPPYLGKNRDDIAQQIEAGPPVPVLKVNPKASRALVKIAEGAMARSLRDRYSHIGDVLADLERARKGSAPRGPRPRINPVKRAVEMCRHHPGAAVGLVVLIAGLALAILFWPRQPKLTLLRTIEVPGVWRWRNVVLDDYDGDGRPELFTDQEDRLIVVAANGQVLNQWSAPDLSVRDLRMGLRADVEGQGSSETLVTWRNGTNLLLSIINQQFVETKRLTIRGERHTLMGGAKIADSDWIPWKAGSINRQGRKELLMRVFTGFEMKPRGLYAYDLEDGSLRWHAEAGPALMDFRSLDLDGDGIEDILCGSNAVCNGNITSENETDDFHSYVFAIRHDGQPLWIRQLGDEFTQSHVLLANLEGAGRKDLVAWVHYGVARRKALGESAWERGQIVRLDRTGQVIRRFDTEHQLMSCLAADLNGDGKDEILATDRFGNLLLLDTDLSLRQKANIDPIRYEKVELLLKAVQDLDLDGQPEVILQSEHAEFISGENPGRMDGEFNLRRKHEPAVLVLNNKLQVLCRNVIQEKWEGDWRGFSVDVADLAGDKRPEIIAFTDKAQVFRYSRNGR